MRKQSIDLTPSEWNLMECLWEHSPRTGREAIDYLRLHAGWNRSTTLTILRRMTEKGYIECREEAGLNVYRPLISRSDAQNRETENFLARVYHGSVSMMMNAITQKQQLSREEIQALYAILQKAEEANDQ